MFTLRRRSAAVRTGVSLAASFALACSVGAAPLDPAGEIDLTFSGDGKEFQNFTTVSTTGFGQAVVSQGSKVVVAGGSNQGTLRDFAVLRLNGDGTPDFSFGDGGVKFIDFGGDDQLQDLAIDSQGRLIGTGFATTTSPTARPAFPIVRFTPDGQLDATFN